MSSYRDRSTDPAVVAAVAALTPRQRLAFEALRRATPWLDLQIITGIDDRSELQRWALDPVFNAHMVLAAPLDPGLYVGRDGYLKRRRARKGSAECGAKIAAGMRARRDQCRGAGA